MGDSHAAMIEEIVQLGLLLASRHRQKLQKKQSEVVCFRKEKEMASETLSVPEEHLAEVIRIIRAGLKVVVVSDEDVRQSLLDWCEGEEEYLRRLSGEEE